MSRALAGCRRVKTIASASELLRCAELMVILVGGGLAVTCSQLGPMATRRDPHSAPQRQHAWPPYRDAGCRPISRAGPRPGKGQLGSAARRCYLVRHRMKIGPVGLLRMRVGVEIPEDDVSAVQRAAEYRWGMLERRV